MTEWYVYLENGVPIEVIWGRHRAVERLLLGTRLTDLERRRITRFLEGPLCDLRSALTVVGYFNGTKEEKTPDKSLVRVVGPGTEV